MPASNLLGDAEIGGIASAWDQNVLLIRGANSVAVFHGLGQSQEDPTKPVYESKTELSLEPGLGWEAKRVLVGRGGIAVAWSDSGAALISDLPSQPREGAQTCSARQLHPALFNAKPSLCLREVRWCPDNDAHLATIASDGVFRMYDVDEPTTPLFQVTVVTDSPIRQSLGETPVSFAFTELDGESVALVLLANGDVHRVTLFPVEEAASNGPLRQNWSDADADEAADFASILALGGGSSAPVLVTATASGLLFHSIVVADGDGRPKLMVYEELSLPKSRDLALGPKVDGDEKDKGSQVWLSEDGSGVGYVVSHQGGIHSVQLTWLAELAAREELSSRSTAAFLLATSGLQGPPALLSSHLLLSFTPQPTVCLLRSGVVGSSPAKTGLSIPEPKQPFLDTVHQMLRKDATIPLLRNEKETGEKERSELIVRVIAVLRAQYVAKLRNARQFAQTKVVQLEGQKATQKNSLAQLIQRWEKVAEKQRAQAERMERQEKAQADLLKRLQRIQLSSPLPLSTAETEHLARLRSLSTAAKSLTANLPLLKEGATALRAQVGRRPIPVRHIGSPLRLGIRHHLNRQQEKLEALAKNLEETEAALPS